MKKITNYDLYKTALAAADSALNAPDIFGVESLKLEAFAAAGHERADFPQWDGYFTSHIGTLSALKSQNSPATSAAIAAEKAAAAAATTTPAQ